MTSATSLSEGLKCRAVDSVLKMAPVSFRCGVKPRWIMFVEEFALGVRRNFAT